VPRAQGPGGAAWSKPPDGVAAGGWVALVGVRLAVTSPLPIRKCYARRLPRLGVGSVPGAAHPTRYRARPRAAPGSGPWSAACHACVTDETLRPSNRLGGTRTMITGLSLIRMNWTFHCHPPAAGTPGAADLIRAIPGGVYLIEEPKDSRKAWSPVWLAATRSAVRTDDLAAHARARLVIKATQEHTDFSASGHSIKTSPAGR